MQITEIYRSIQGESSFAGLPCIFVRLTACNLRCVWCDSEYTFTGGKKMSPEEIEQEVLRLSPGDTTALLDAAFAGRFPDPDQRRAAVEQFQRASGTPEFLANSIAFYTQTVFLNEVVDGSFAIIGARNSITFTAYAGETTQLSADALGILPDALLTASVIRQRGFARGNDRRAENHSLQDRQAETLIKGRKDDGPRAADQCRQGRKADVIEPMNASPAAFAHSFALVLLGE